MILLLLLAILQWTLWFGHGGRSDLAALQHRLALQAQDTAALVARNAVLAAEVSDLKNGMEAVEERARAELGMIQPEEVFVQVVDRTDDALVAK